MSASKADVWARINARAAGFTFDIEESKTHDRHEIMIKKYLNHDHHENHDRSNQQKDHPTITLVNTDESMTAATNLLGVFPQKLFQMVQKSGPDRVRRACAFVVSLWTETAYFRQYGAAGKTRARNLLIDLALSPNKPIFENLAGPKYRAKWGA